ncbi:MAG: bifunctional methylenetetrahydrofolate dehydrogenase/methenyltetrahydrofolate cyclohydrolase FolD [Prevotella sp.]|nr:bifunctional methylenetetrahydrofolate dehydrogenase/methenyltetrahydrofolate cyclohydrolase FolD [Prevotella sp.]
MEMRHKYQTATSNYTLLEEFARENRNNPTEAERALWEYLRGGRMGAHFRRQHVMMDYIPDFVSLAEKLVIEVDGGYHHEGEQPQLDAERTAEFVKQGFKVLRFSNEEVLCNLDNVLETIRKEIRMSKDVLTSHPSLGEGPGSVASAAGHPSLGEGPGVGLIDGKATATQIKAEIAKEVKEIMAAGGKRPHLAAVLVGHDGGSETYVKNKVLACEQCGFKSTLIRYEADVTEEELLSCVSRLNLDDDVDGFIVQLPLPKHINEQNIIEAIDYRKDVDGFHPINVGRMAIGLPCFISATPLGILTLLKRYNVETSGKKCVILGRSNIVGKPMAQLMLQKQYGDATVTVCHSHSKTLKEECRQADIIIAAIGQPNFVTADMVKEGAVVIDVGTTRVPDSSRKSGFRLNGDVKFDEVAPKCSYITPVPGGVGPMTICSLMLNTLKAGKKEYYK